MLSNNTAIKGTVVLEDPKNDDKRVFLNSLAKKRVKEEDHAKIVDQTEKDIEDRRMDHIDIG